MPLRSRNLYAFFCSFLVLAFALSAQQKGPESPASPILGFSPPHAAAEHQLENTFQSIPSPEKAREWHRTSPPNLIPPLPTAITSSPISSRTKWRKQGW